MCISARERRTHIYVRIQRTQNTMFGWFLCRLSIGIEYFSDLNKFMNVCTVFCIFLFLNVQVFASLFFSLFAFYRQVELEIYTQWYFMCYVVGLYLVRNAWFYDDGNNEKFITCFVAYIKIIFFHAVDNHSQTFFLVLIYLFISIETALVSFLLCLFVCSLSKHVYYLKW